MLSFSEALDKLKNGYSVLRYSSDIEMKEISFISTENSTGIYSINYNDYSIPFTPTFNDLMAEDWYVVCKTFDGTYNSSSNE